MEKLDIMRARHSVRRYTDKPIEGEVAEKLRVEIEAVNAESGLNIQLFLNEPGAFKGNEPHYGQFSCCRNYFACVGPKGADEAIGYYGERLVLFAQELGLNTCWVALTYKKGAVQPKAGPGEKLHIVIALGYGETQGASHKVKDAERISNVTADSPQWFKDGVEAALLAPTAMNQQKFYLEQKGSTVIAKAKMGFYAKIDLGIVKRHFELGAGKENFAWG